MKDNFDLKKFLKESKAIENLNPSLKAINDKESKSLKEITTPDNVKTVDKDGKVITHHDELETEMYEMPPEKYISTLKKLGYNVDMDWHKSQIKRLKNSTSLKEKIREMIINELSEDNVSVGGDVRGTINPAAPITKASNDDYDFLSESDDLHEEDKDKRDMDGLVKAMMANRKAIKKREEEEDAKRQADYERHKKSMGLEEAEKDEDGEEMEDESREERADVDKYEFEKGKEAGEEEGEGGIEAIAADLDGTESDLMGNLMNALKIAKGMDNEKLEVQIGNTLKFFVSTYIDKEENER